MKNHVGVKERRQAVQDDGGLIGAPDVLKVHSDPPSLDQAGQLSLEDIALAF